MIAKDCGQHRSRFLPARLQNRDRLRPQARITAQCPPPVTGRTSGKEIFPGQPAPNYDQRANACQDETCEGQQDNAYEDPSNVSWRRS